MHYGHANALRQARALGDYLVVGVHSDAEIEKHKGPTVFTEQERYKMIRACKWADEVVEGAPYIATLETLDKYKCNFCVHGEDITVDDQGRDVYEGVKKAGRYKTIKRTEGISTTQLVNRILFVDTRHMDTPNKEGDGSIQQKQEDWTHHSPYTSMSHFLPTTRKIAQFANAKSPKPNDKIVYIDGGFDLYHVGHVEAIRQAKELGDYLIVGVHDDSVINQVRGGNFPVMNLHERVLGVLSSRYVDEVVLGAPFAVTEDMIKQLRINLVIHGDDPVLLVDGKDPYEVPRKLKIYKEVHATPGFHTSDIVQRIVDSRLKYEARNKKKEAKEVQYLEEHKQSN